MKKLLTIFFTVLVLFGTANAQVTVTEDVTENTTWTADNEYMLNGLVFVDSTVTLTIEAGTVIKGLEAGNITSGEGASALIVRRGAKIMAEGTQEAPIIFTTELDDISLSDDMFTDDRGLWGGIIILGEATTNQPSIENQIEGIPLEQNAKYGGTNDEDNSGVLKYVSIRHGGFSISGVSGDEINGLTLGAVGSGTVIENIEVFANFDDGVEWFGGTVGIKYLAVAFCGDDCFDYDQGWRGQGQFWLALQGTDEAGRGGEHDGGDDNETGSPYAIPVISNATYIGSGADATGLAGDGSDRALYFRDNAGGKYSNSIFTDFTGVAIKIEDLDSGEDSRARLEAGDLELRNNYWYNFGGGSTFAELTNLDILPQYLTDNDNMLADPMLRGISRTTDNGLDPRPEDNSPVITGAVLPGGTFFNSVEYLGAFDPNSALWTDGWTALDEYGITSDFVVGVQEAADLNNVPTEYTLKQNYPNPFNPSTKIEFTLPESGVVKLTIFNLLGQAVETLVNDVKPAGTYTMNWNASNLTSGVYFYRLQAGNKVFTKKMMLMK